MYLDLSSFVHQWWEENKHNKDTLAITFLSEHESLCDTLTRAQSVDYTSHLYACSEYSNIPMSVCSWTESHNTCILLLYDSYIHIRIHSFLRIPSHPQICSLFEVFKIQMWWWYIYFSIFSHIHTHLNLLLIRIVKYLMKFQPSPSSLHHEQQQPVYKPSRQAILSSFVPLTQKFQAQSSHEELQDRIHTLHISIGQKYITHIVMCHSHFISVLAKNHQHTSAKLAQYSEVL